MKVTQPKRVTHATFDLTPMIDVVLLLIIFFSLTANYSRSVASPMDLPRERGDETVPDEATSVMIDVDSYGMISVGNEPCELANLVSRIMPVKNHSTEALKNLDVVIRADRHCATNRFDAIVRVLAEAGITHCRMATTGTSVPGT